MKTSMRRVCRPLMITAIAGALVGVPSVATATTHHEELRATATYKSAGHGWDGVIDGRAAGTNVLERSGIAFDTFCIQYGIPAATEGKFTTRTWKESGVKGLDKASDVAQRHKDIAGKLSDARSENAAAQLAIWSFTDGVDFSKVPNQEIVARANALVAAAKPAAEANGLFQVSVDTKVFDKDGAKNTHVTVTVMDQAGKPLNNAGVRLLTGKESDAGKEAVMAMTKADGVATFEVLTPEVKVGKIELVAPFEAGTVWAPANDLQLVIGTAATMDYIPMAAGIELGGEVDAPIVPEPVEPEPKPEPKPEPPVTEAPAPAPAPEPKPEAKPGPDERPDELPDTGALGTGAAVAALTALGAGAGFAAWRMRRTRA